VFPGIGVHTSKTTQYRPDAAPNTLLQAMVWAETPSGWRLILRHSCKA